MTDNTRKNEIEILRRTVGALLGVRGSVLVCYEDDHEGELIIDADTPWEQIEAEAFACDMTTLRVHSQWVLFIWGNGEEGLTCISDYTVSLEDALKPVFDWIEKKESQS